MFGVVASATLRLVPRRTVRRVVEIVTADALMRRVDERIAAGFLYGDFQFAIDPASDDFLHRGVFSTYAPMEHDVAIPAEQRALSMDDWQRLLDLAHTRKSDAFGLRRRTTSRRRASSTRPTDAARRVPRRLSSRRSTVRWAPGCPAAR